MKKAILFGASGFIGSYLLADLLESPEYETVTIVVRQPLALCHPKLNLLTGDFRTVQDLNRDLVGDEIFIALGTTRKNTPQREEYYQVDHDYPLLAAKIAKENGAKSVFIVTSIGANPSSKFFYIKTKGQIERDVQALDFQHTHIFQPSLILGHRKEHRTMERALIKAWGIIDPLLVGGFDRYRGIDSKDIAQAMVNAAKNQTEKVKFYQWQEMRAVLGRGLA